MKRLITFLQCLWRKIDPPLSPPENTIRLKGGRVLFLGPCVALMLVLSGCTSKPSPLQQAMMHQMANPSSSPASMRAAPSSSFETFYGRR